MAIYYFLPYIASIFIGTMIAAFLTGIFGNRYASIHRAFIFSASKFCLLMFLGTYFSFYEYWVILLLIGYYFLFARIFHVKSFVRGMRFLFLSTVFSMSSRIILLGPLADYASGFIY